MVIVDFKKNSGLSVGFDGNDLQLQENGLELASKEEYSIHDVRSQLLNPALTCPNIFYYHFRGVDRKSLLKRKGLKLDILVMPSNLAGIEYVKTKGIRIRKYPILIDAIHGFLTVLIMKNLDNPTPDSPIVSGVVKLRKGEKYVIPPDCGFIFVNVKQQLCALSMIYSDKLRLEGCFDDTRGATNYLIRKNARQEIVQNPFFRFVKEVRMDRPGKIYKTFNLTAKTPIFKQILRKYQRFKWLHNSELVDWDKLLHTL